MKNVHRIHRPVEKAGVTIFLVIFVIGEIGFAPTNLSAAPLHVGNSLDAAAIRMALATKDFAGLQQAIGRAIAPLACKKDFQSQPFLANPTVQRLVAQYEFIRCCGYGPLAEIAERKQGVEFLTDVLTHPCWAEEFVSSNPPEDSYGQALQNLYLIYRHGDGCDKAVYRRMATAMALSGGKINAYRLVDRFRHTKRAHQELLLHAGFDDMEVREMRLATLVNNADNAFGYQYLLDDRMTTLREYGWAHTAVRYQGISDFGHSIVQPLHSIPWAHAYARWQLERMIGGLCGAQGMYAVSVARAHGIVAMPVTEPGHLAYIVRRGQSWWTGNSMGGGTGCTPPGWEGTNFPTMLRLYEPVLQDRERYLDALRMSWLAHVLAEESVARVRLVAPLKYRLFERYFDGKLADLATLPATKEGTTPSIDVAAVAPKPPQRFGVVWDGSLEVIGQKAAVIVDVNADDGCRVVIDGKPVVEKWVGRQTVTVPLDVGQHAVRVEYYQGGHGYHLKVNFSCPYPMGDWVAAMDEAVKIQPCNYPVWLDYVQMLGRCGDVPLATWPALGRRAAAAFAAYPEAGFAITQRIITPALGRLSPEELSAFFVDCHRSMRQENADRFIMFGFGGWLNWQAERIGNLENQMAWLRQLMSVHMAKEPNDWMLSEVLSWGQRRFGNNPKTKQQFMGFMKDFLLEHRESLSRGFLCRHLGNGIQQAEKAGDFAEYRVWSHMATDILGPLSPSDLKLTNDQAKRFPTFKGFPGDVLSRDGMLRLSSWSGYDRAYSHANLLMPEFPGGFFHTNGESNPWVQVELPVAGELTGIVVVNRYEEYPKRHVPQKISVSMDGKTWEEVTTFTEYQPMFEVDLQGKSVRAKWVRVERLPSAGHSQEFHLRNLVVYGRKDK